MLRDLRVFERDSGKNYLEGNENLSVNQTDSLPISTVLNPGFQICHPLLRWIENQAVQGKYKKFNGVSLLQVVLEWTMGPAIACVTAFCFFRFLQITVLRQENSEKRVLIFLLFYYGTSAGLLCLFIQYQVISHRVTPEPWETAVVVILATLVGAMLPLFVVVPLARKRLIGAERTSVNKRNRSWKRNSKENINQDAGGGEESEEEKFESALKQYMEMRISDTVYEEDEQNSASPTTNPDANQVSSVSNSVVVLLFMMREKQEMAIKAASTDADGAHGLGCESACSQTL